MTERHLKEKYKKKKNQHSVADMNMGKYAKETRQNNQNSNTGIFVLGFVHFK